MSNPAIAASPTPSAVPRDVSVTTNAEPFKSQDRSRGTSKLGAWEIEDDGRPPFILSVAEMKLLAISGVGFFLDAYDLFIINPVSTMLQFLLYDGNQIPAGLQGVLKASANIGSILGQFGFGMAADYFGRRAVYGKELMLIIFATIMCISNPTNHLSPNDAIVWLICWRVVLGVGVGGDYPMSASVATDRSNLRKRGVMLSYIFSSQGWGSFVGSIVVMTVLLCYKHVMETKGETSKVDGVWRIVIGVSLIPAFGTLYHRLTLPETTRFIKASAGLRVQDEESSRPVPTNEKTHTSGSSSEASSSSDPVEPKTSHVDSPEVRNTDNPLTSRTKNLDNGKRAHLNETLVYFSEWRHAKHLIGTSLSWFLLDIAFYGINLNQNVVLQEINFDGSTGTPWHRLWRVSIGNLIITGLGFVPGYYATVLTIEYLGRKWIQVQGFLLEALFRKLMVQRKVITFLPQTHKIVLCSVAILASKFHTLGTAAFIVNFSLLQFFFNFGANATTFAYPAELFPTRFRATAHGVSAACGKGGAVISALGFNALSKDVGTPAVLWIFFGCSLAGAVVTVVCLPEVKGRDPDLVYEQELRAMQSVGE